MEVDVWIGDMGRADRQWEIYRRAELTIDGFHYYAMDVPDERYPYVDSSTLTIDLADATAFASPKAAFNCRMWVGEWNGFIHVSAMAASLRWLGEPVNRG